MLKQMSSQLSLEDNVDGNKTDESEFIIKVIIIIT